MFISLPLCSGALKCKGKTLLITLLLKDQQPGEMYFVTFSLWSLFFLNENGDIHSGLRSSARRWVFNESLLTFPWALRGTAGATSEHADGHRSRGSSSWGNAPSYLIWFPLVRTESVPGYV